MTKWVEVLFTRLLTRYGDAWVRKWEGIPMQAVHDDWQETLESVYLRNPMAIKYALTVLPDYPPTVDAFLKLCHMAPAVNAPMLSAPPADPERIKAALASVTAKPVFDCAKMAADLLRARRERSGGKLGYPQRAQLEALEAIGK